MLKNLLLFPRKSKLGQVLFFRKKSGRIVPKDTFSPSFSMRLPTYFRKMLTLHSKHQRFCWLWFTCFFGLQPIVWRCISAFSHPDIAYFAISDVIFFGLMLNAAAAYNTIIDQRMKDLLIHVVGLTSLLSTCLVIVYVLSLTQAFSSLFAWCLTLIAVIPSLLLSFFTSDVETMLETQNLAATANQIGDLPEPLRSEVRDIIRRVFDGKQIDIESALAHCFDEDGNLLAEYRRRKTEVEVML